MAEAEQVSEVRNGPPQSKIVLAKPRLGGFGSVALSESISSGNQHSKSGTSLLRPPQLKPVLSNPFLNVKDVEDDAPKNESSEERLEESKNEETEPPKFVPLGGKVKACGVRVPTSAQAGASSSRFVFGENLSERAVTAEALDNGAGAAHLATNGNSDLLFTSAANKVDLQKTEEASREGGAGLAEAAAEYERSHARPTVLASPHPTTTGEEQETNVLQVTCRLYAWEAGSWRERGRGVLRLNDCLGGGARLVVRVLGSLRVALNTNVWPEMVNERAGAKSLRITATDVENHVKVFLVMASPSDILLLNRELSTRIARASTLKPNTDTSHADPQHITTKLPDFDEMSHDAAEIESRASETASCENGADAASRACGKRKESPTTVDADSKRACVDDDSKRACVDADH